MSDKPNFLRDFSKERKDLADRSEEEVGMWEGKRITVLPTDQLKRLMTQRPAGCDVSIVFAENDDGSRLATMAHYPAPSVDEHERKIAELLRGSGFDRAPLKKAVILTENKFGESPDERQQRESLIETRVKSELGSDIQVEVQHYSGKVSDNESGVIAVVPPHGTGEPFWTSWLGGSKLR